MIRYVVTLFVMGLLFVPTICFGTTDGLSYTSFGKNDWFEFIETNRSNALWAPRENVVYAVGDKGFIARYAAKDRDIMSSPTDHDLVEIWGKAENDIYAVGKKGTLLHYDGEKWKAVSTGHQFDFRSVWKGEDGTVYIAGDDKRLLSFDGDKWKATIIAGNSEPLQSVCELSYLGEVYVLSEKGTIYVFRKGKWEQVRKHRDFDFTPYTIKKMSAGDKSRLYFLTDAGTIQFTEYWAQIIPYPDYKFAGSGDVVDLWGMGTYHFVSTDNGGLFMHDGYIWAREKGFSGDQVKDIASVPDSMKTYCLGADAHHVAQLETGKQKKSPSAPVPQPAAPVEVAPAEVTPQKPPEPVEVATNESETEEPVLDQVEEPTGTAPEIEPAREQLAEPGIVFKAGSMVVTTSTLFGAMTISLPAVVILLMLSRRRKADPRKEYRRRR